MAANRIYDKLFENFGVDFTLVAPHTEFSFSCIFQPLRYKNKIYLSGIPTELGYNSLRKYLIMTSPDVPLEGVDGVNCYLSFDGHKYDLDHFELVYLKNKPLYYWAIVHREDAL